METDENLTSLVIAEVKNGELILDLKKEKHISRSTKLNVYITIKNLNELAIEGVNEVSSSILKLNDLLLKSNGVGSNDLQITCKKLEAHLSGVGSTTLNGSADSASIDNNGVGALKAYDFVVKNLRINNSGVGSVEVNAVESIKMNNNGVGSIKHKGDAVIKESNNDGVGKIKKE